MRFKGWRRYTNIDTIGATLARVCRSPMTASIRHGAGFFVGQSMDWEGAGPSAGGTRSSRSFRRMGRRAMKAGAISRAEDKYAPLPMYHDTRGAFFITTL